MAKVMNKVLFFCLGGSFVVCFFMFLEIYNPVPKAIILVEVNLDAELDEIIDMASTRDHEKALQGMLLTIRGARLSGNELDLFNHMTKWSKSFVEKHRRRIKLF